MSTAVTTTDPVAESDAKLQRLASKLHDKAFAAGKPQSFADSLKAAARDILADAGANFPDAARKNLLRYAPAAAEPAAALPADPIGDAETAAEKSNL